MINYELQEIVEDILGEETDGYNRFGSRKLHSIKSTIKDDTTRSRVEEPSELAKEAIESRIYIPANDAFDALVYSLRNSSKILFKLDTGREGASGVAEKFKFGKEVFAWAYNLSAYGGKTQGRWSAGARSSKGVGDIIYKLYKKEIKAAFQLPAFSKDAFCVMADNPLFNYALFMKGEPMILANRNLYYSAFDKLIYEASAHR